LISILFLNCSRCVKRKSSNCILAHRRYNNNIICKDVATFIVYIMQSASSDVPSTNNYYKQTNYPICVFVCNIQSDYFIEQQSLYLK
jgi:hypothetical protein